MNSQPSDEELIDQFLVGEHKKAQSAFEQLVTRHRSLVMGVCRHVLKQEQDAEDVFQATFLTLARRAATIQNPRGLGSWLREVAFRNALRLRAQVVRRRALPALRSEEVSPAEAERTAAHKELRLILQTELDRLPKECRTLVVHCYLEGKTNQEVAQLLGFPVGTVKGRLGKARAMLREGLLRRGGRDADAWARAWG
jgi:RNA polymerase sigma-70 factor (ECF subfamily)